MSAIESMPDSSRTRHLLKFIQSESLSDLNGEERQAYYMAVCKSLGLNPLTKPFEFLYLKGKLTLYARREATEQLRKINGISLQVISRELIGDVYIVTVRAVDKQGRYDESTGAVYIGPVKGQKQSGEQISNAYMTAETKAKRRVTLSICGLGCLSEEEIESIPQEDKRNAHNPMLSPPISYPELTTQEPRADLIPFAQALSDLKACKSNPEIDMFVREIRGPMRHFTQEEQIKLKEETKLHRVLVKEFETQEETSLNVEEDAALSSKRELEPA